MEDKISINGAVVRVLDFFQILGDYDISKIALLQHIYSFLEQGLILTSSELRSLDKVINEIINTEDLLNRKRRGDTFMSDYYSTMRLGNINLKPIIIEDIEESVFPTQELVFTTEHFLKEVNENYFDPEGDGLYKLKIYSLPSIGVLMLNSVLVYKNQEILFSDIELGLFTYLAGTIEETTNLTFDFGISDIGSKKYLK